MIPTLLAAHAITSILIVALMGEIDAEHDVTYLVVLAFNGAQALFEALAIRRGDYEAIDRTKRTGR